MRKKSYTINRDEQDIQDNVFFLSILYIPVK